MKAINNRLDRLENELPKDDTGNKKYRLKLEGRTLIVNDVPEFLKPNFKGYEST